MKNINYYENKAAYEADENRPASESTVSSVGDGTGVIFSGKNVLVDKSGAGVGDILVFDKSDSVKKFIKYGTFHAATLPSSIVTIGVVWKKTEDNVCVIAKTIGYQRWAQGYKVKLSGFDLEDGGGFTIMVNSTTTDNIVYGADSTLANIATLINTAINAGAPNSELYHWEVAVKDDYITIEHDRSLPGITSVSVADLDNKITVDIIAIDYQAISSGLQTEYSSIVRNDKSSSSYAGGSFDTFYDYYYTSGGDTANNQAVGAGDPLRYSRYNLTDNPNIVNFYGAGETGYRKYIQAKMAFSPYPKGAMLSRNGKNLTDSMAEVMFTDSDGVSKPVYNAAYFSKNVSDGIVSGYSTGLEPGAWWLPSAFEFLEIIKDIPTNQSDKVNISMAAIGGAAISPSISHWTSSEYSYRIAWTYDGTRGLLSYTNKYTSISVRAVTAF